jgi:hypothetical protein
MQGALVTTHAGESQNSRTSSSTGVYGHSAADCARTAHTVQAAAVDLSWPPARNEIAFFHLSQKMPGYALKSHFEKYGPVQQVFLHDNDPRCDIPLGAT